MIRALIIGEYGDRPEAALLAGLHRENIHVTPIYRPGTAMYAALEQAGPSPIPLEPRSKFDFRAVRKLRAITRRDDFQILHAFTSRTMWLGLLACHGNSRIRIIWHRGTVYYPRPWRFQDRFTFFNNSVNCFVCICKAVSKALVDSGVPQGKVRTIYKGHSPAWYREEPLDVRKEWKIPTGRFLIGTVANVRPVKGLETIVRAGLDLARQRIEFHAIIVGRDPGDFLRRLAKKLGLEDRFSFTGYRDDACRMVPNFDCFLMPSLAGEGLSKAVLEAMLMDVPVIASSVGGLPELVEDGVTGLLFPPGDQAALAARVALLASDTVMRQRLAGAARLKVQREISVETMVAQTAALYQELSP